MISVAVTEASQVAEARRRASGVALSLGFDETAGGRVAIVVTELATNLVKYGTDGEILIGIFEDETGTGVQILALDRGTGISDVAAVLRDGFSTGGSPGTGLGAVRRQSQAFDIAAWPRRGLAVLARIGGTVSKGSSGAPGPIPYFGAVGVPLRGEVVNGDAYCIRPHGKGWTVLVADGLGHGPQAAQASDAAVRVFRAHDQEPPGRILAAVHAGLGHTRGGAVSVARYDPEREVLVFTGIGNVAGGVITGGVTKRLVSLAGTAGLVARRIQEFEYPFTPQSLLVMCSDGIGTSWSLDNYPGLAGAHPSLVAGVIYRDFARGRDDATVVVARDPAS
ncbi:ATP-binding SpoIIE family protein phosphatase [Methylobacterium sp.]|uniref:ATP-binding SpoIIE family protein phosphatase n=1 Tax=Methylobacterium sp. TaxID=409 RepID=UPI0025D4F253|nr:ATP-binding SpoIIE family protein phosphatase [Methylobacterium sp.]MBY0256465.1 SpoIIE family protein phosphatase [Methylobacterium sp.]